MNSTDFFAWDSGNFSTILLQSLNSQSALDVYFWVAVTGIFVVFILPYLAPLIAFLGGLCLSFVFWVTTGINARNSATREIRNAKLRRDILNFAHFVARCWHGYEVIGWENIPKTAAILVLYHGAIALDGNYLHVELCRRNIRPNYGIADRRVINMKGWQDIHRAVKLWAYNREECTEILKKNGHILVAPGGIEESRYSQNYQVYFAGRQGFARLALETNAAVIPVFTQNVREAFWIPWFTRPFVSGWFAPKKIEFIPAGGGLPVKLTTFIGKPVEYDDTYTVDQLVSKVKDELQQLINKHQRLPGNRLYATLDRFCCNNKIKMSDKEKKFITLA